MQAAIYMRLSREDGEGESESIQTQRTLLQKEVKSRGWCLIGEYIDDGYSGLTFNRPGFQALCRAVEEKKVQVVLVKDLSRLGRDYTRTGYYLEHYFPRRNVRFLSLGEGIDTGQQNSANDFAPFQSVLNDLYARDISRKVRLALAARRAQGRFMGATAPYGYAKGEKGSLHLVPEEAAVIRSVAVWSFWGKSNRAIAEELQKLAIKPPGYRETMTGSWGECAVRRMLHSEAVTGTCVQGKTKRLSYKEPRRVPGNPVVTPNAWEEILPHWFFEALQRKRRAGSRKGVFTGQFFCGACRVPLQVHHEYLICPYCGQKFLTQRSEAWARRIFKRETGMKEPPGTGDLLRWQRSWMAACFLGFYGQPDGNFWAEPVKDWEKERLCAILRRKDFAKGLFYGQEVLCGACRPENRGVSHLG